MNTLKKIISLSIVASVLIFTGCEKDETVQTLDKETAKQSLNENSQDLESSLQEMENTQGMDAIQTLGALTRKADLFAQQKAAGNESIISSLQKVLKPVRDNKLKRVGDTPFNFSQRAGTYTWMETKQWNVTLGDPEDKIVINFPTDTTQDQVANNAVLTLSNFNEIATTDSLENTTYVPERVQADLSVDGTEVMNVDYTLDYDTDTDVLNSLSTNVFMKPFTWNLNLTPKSIDASLSKEGMESTLISFAFDVTFMDNMEDVQKVDGHVQLRNLDLKGWVKPYNIGQVEDESFWAEQGWETFDDALAYVNEQIDVALYKFDTGNKIADLKLVQSEDTQSDVPVNVVLVFKDGSTEPAQQYFQNVIEYIRGMMQNYSVGEPSM